jgi:hypothetical protein
MLTEFTGDGTARAVRNIWDISEDVPIPRGAIVSLEDWDGCADLWVVQWQGRIYLATADELRP